MAGFVPRWGSILFVSARGKKGNYVKYTRSLACLLLLDFAILDLFVSM